MSVRRPIRAKDRSRSSTRPTHCRRKARRVALARAAPSMGATHWPGTIAVFGTWLFASGFTGCFLTKFANLDFITAADHNWVVTLTNYGGDIIPIHGNTQPRTTLNLTQISCGQQFRGDPQVRVDNANRWWFAVVTSLNLFGDPSGECLSVSIGTDPRGPYYEYFYPGAVDGLWLGVSSTK